MATPTSEFFDRMAPAWDTYSRVYPEKIAHILDVAEVKEGDNVLDVGTGTGVLIPYLEERIGEYGAIDAVDVSEGMLEQARLKFHDLNNVRLIHADVEEDVLEGLYDVITLYCMYPHLQSPIPTLQWLMKVNLKPGGRLVIAFPESKERINGIHHHNDGSVHSDHLKPADKFRDELEGAGLQVDYTEDTPEYYIVRLRGKSAGE